MQTGAGAALWPRAEPPGDFVGDLAGFCGGNGAAVFPVQIGKHGLSEAV